MAGQRAVRTPASLGAHTVTVHTWNTHRAGLRRVQCGHPRMLIHNGVQGWRKHHCCREHRTEMIPGLKHTYHRPQTPIHRVIRMLTNTQNSLLCCQGENTFTELIFFFFNRREHREARGLCLLKAKFIKKKKKDYWFPIYPPHPFFAFTEKWTKGTTIRQSTKWLNSFTWRKPYWGQGRVNKETQS